MGDIIDVRAVMMKIFDMFVHSLPTFSFLKGTSRNGDDVKLQRKYKTCMLQLIYVRLKLTCEVFILYLSSFIYRI